MRKDPEVVVRWRKAKDGKVSVVADIFNKANGERVAGMIWERYRGFTVTIPGATPEDHIHAFFKDHTGVYDFVKGYLIVEG